MTADVPVPTAAAIVVAIITVILVHYYYRAFEDDASSSSHLVALATRRLRAAVKSRASRRELRRIAGERDDEEGSSRIRRRGGGGGGGDDEDDDVYVGPVVSGIFIHPAKSLRPVSISETAFDRHGLIHDRRLMIVRPTPNPDDGEYSHRFFTQRQSPRLATIEATEPVDISSGGDDGDGGRRARRVKTLIRLSSSLVPDAHVYIDVHPTTLKTLPIRYRVGLWGDVVDVVDVGDEAAEYVSNVVRLDHPSFDDVRVVYICDSTSRRVNGAYCPDAARVGFFGSLPHGGLTDGFPILVATQASLDELNRRLTKKGKDRLPMSRFRPNIVIDNTSGPFDEDNWKAIRIGRGKDAAILHIVKGCPRCKQSCTDQSTGERGDEPLETLSDFRALGTSDADVYFAQNAVLDGDSYASTIRVGDPVTILTRGVPVWDAEKAQAE